MPKVFISYSHDSPEHSARVLEFANALRREHGVDVELDQYHVRPEHGWPHWCEEQLRAENAEFVLLVCTETYRQRVENKVPADEGHGVYWEGAIIYDYLYDAKGNRRFIPILFDGAKSDCIPRPIRSHTRYSIATFSLDDDGYHKLYRELTRQPAVEKPSLGERIALGPASPILSPLPVREVKALFGSPARPSALPAGVVAFADPSLLGLVEGLAERTRRTAAADNAVLVNRGQIQVPWKIMRQGPGAAVLPGARFAGPQHLPSVLTSTPSGQLVIVGDPGSGKSVMVEQLILELLACRREGDRVPVLFRLSSWNPRVESLSDWMLNQLLEEDEEVAATVARTDARDVGGTLVQLHLPRSGRVRRDPRTASSVRGRGPAQYSERLRITGGSHMPYRGLRAGPGRTRDSICCLPRKGGPGITGNGCSTDWMPQSGSQTRAVWRMFCPL
jgi:hypothetical protein